MADDQMQISIKGKPEHIDQAIPMLRGYQDAPLVPDAAALKPPPSAAPVLGRTILGAVPSMQAAEAAGNVGMPTAPGNPTAPAAPIPRTKLGELGHILGRVGEIAGTAVIPHVMPWIPGTEQHQQMEDALQQEREDQASKRGLEGAQSDLAEARAHQLGEPGVPTEKMQAFQDLISKGVAPIDAYKQVEEAGFKPGTQTRKAEFFMGPDGKPIQGYSEGGQNFLATGEPLPSGYMPYKAAAPMSGHPVAGSINNNPAWGLFDPQKGWVDPTSHEPLKGFTPPPSWAEVMPATHTITLTNPDTGLPTVYQYNPVTKTFSQSAGTAGTGTYAHQIQSGHAVERMVNSSLLPLIDQMEKKGEMGVIKGRFSDWLNRDVGNAPPDVAQLHQLMNGVVSMMMGLYGFRRQEAVERLDRQMGARMTPESMRGALKGIMQHAQSIIGQTAPATEEKQQGKPVYVDGKLVGHTIDGKTMIPVK